MTAYVFVTMDVSDPEQLATYAAAARPIAEKFGGKYIVRGGAYRVLEGEFSADRVTIVAFPDRAAAEAWYESQEYTKAKSLRENAALATFVVVDGV